MTNPYLPPSTEVDRAMSAEGPGDWTVATVLKQAVAAVRRQPGMALLAIVILPTLWAVPVELLERRLVPPETPVSGPDRPLLQFVLSWLVVAWNNVCFPGQLQAALNAAAGRPIRLGDFVSGLRKVPQMVAMAVLLGVPLEVASFLPFAPEATESGLALGVAGLISIFLAVRLVFWPPLLMQPGARFWGSLSASWQMTSGRSWRLLGIGAVVVLLSVPVYVIESALLTFDGLVASFSVLGALFTLATAQAYVLATAPANEKANTD
jgi:hypothetical protein